MRHKGGHDPSRSIPYFLKDELALLWRIPFPTGFEHNQFKTALRERIKELNCLYGIFKLSERHQSNLDTFLQELVNFLPHSWQYAEKTCARIVFRDKTYTSTNFRISKWRQSSQVHMYNEAVGECAIFYIDECPPADEGPFLNEERALLDAVADQIGTIATRIAADLELQDINQQLVLKQQTLQELNTALKVILARNEREKQEIYLDIRNNIDKILVPILNSLAFQVQPSQKNYIELLKTNLEEIASPFIGGLSQSCYALSPTEIAVSNMVKNGMTTKQIATLRGVTTGTINRHREKIRSKLKITNKDINLNTFLQSNMNKTDNDVLP